MVQHNTMRKRKTTLSIIFLTGLVTLVTACVSATPYGPASRNGFGYVDQRIDNNRYRVAFRGNAATRRETVENFLLLRSAELTVQNGFDYFVIVENDTEAQSYFTSLYGSGHGSFGSFHGRFSPYYGNRFGRFGAFPYYPYGFGFGPGPFVDSVRENTQYSAIAFISMHKGDKPGNERAAFNAREVVDNLRPLINQQG